MAETPYTNFQLEPGQIRLLNLHPAAEDDDLLVCSFEIFSLGDQDIGYFAVSYTWGGQPFDHAVQVDEDVLEVTASCYEALHVFRKQKIPTIWIDQLSIDQTNIDERNQQITMMGRIYEKATAVFVWLGQPGERNRQARSYIESQRQILQSTIYDNQGERRDADAARNALATLDSHLAVSEARSNQSYVSLLPFLNTLNSESESLPQALQDPAVWDGLFDLLNRPYFKRRWIIQEIALNDRVVFVLGEIPIPWGVLLAAVLRIEAQIFAPNFPGVIAVPHPHGENFRKELLIPLMCFKTIWKLHGFRQRNERISLLFALEQCLSFETTELPDCLYSVRGFVTDTGSLPQPDYKLKPEEVFVQHARYVIEMGEGPLMIMYAGLYGRVISKLPSWCPNWSWDQDKDIFWLAKVNSSYPGEQEEHVMRKFDDVYLRAAGSTTASITVGDDPWKVIVSGSIVDEVVAVTVNITQDNYISGHGEHVSFVAKSKRASFELDKAIEWANQIRDGAEAPWEDFTEGGREMHAAIDLYLKCLCLPESSHFAKLDFRALNRSPTNRVFNVYMATVFGGRVLCASKQGYIGFVTNITQPGDQIAIFDGFTVPMIVRPNAEGCYELVGDSWFLGLSRGEALGLEMYSKEDIVLF